MLITNSVSPAFAIPGQIVTWTITVTNRGNIAANDVEVRAAFAEQLDILSATCTFGTLTQAGQAIQVTYSQLDPAQSSVITVQTLIRRDTPLPFFISTRAELVAPDNAAAQYASATVVSASQLPHTGEPLRTLVVLIVGMVVFVVIANSLRRRITK